MLRDAGVRTKLLAVLAIPTVLLMLVTGVLVAGQVAAAKRAGQVKDLTTVAIQVNRVVHSLQEERGATLLHLGASDAGTAADMEGQRRFSDRQIRKLDRMYAKVNDGGLATALETAIKRTQDGHKELKGARASVDNNRFFSTEADVFYSKIIRADLDLPGVIAATSSEPELGRRLQAYQSLSSVVEYTAHERDVVEVGLLAGRMNEGTYAQTGAYVAQQNQGLQDFQAKAPEALFMTLDEKLAAADLLTIDATRRSTTDLLVGIEPDLGQALEWSQAMNYRVFALTEAEEALLNDVSTQATRIQKGQEDRALLLLGSAIVGLGFAMILAVALARRITRPLRRLTVAAGEIGDELPRMVERMQTPGEGPGVTVEPIEIESQDEIGRLAEAFNTVNEVTVRVAKEQAALRSSIAEMFVNVARRNQVLLGRQLKALDQMEATEEDPDVLERLFSLDHLATRMRRNAESLLVLAGIDSARRLRTALPLSDVIRTAVGEIESFDRIDLSMTEDPDVSGRHALSIAHLLAELLENATHFSNPDTRVVVSATPTTAGMSVSITDYGLGMSDEEIAEANENIATPPVAEIAVSQRLGLFVVGRLAKRLGATAELRRGRTAGMVVTVLLPGNAFEGMVFEEPEPEVEAVAPASPEAEAQLAEGPEPLETAEVPELADVEVAEFTPAAEPERVIELEKPQPVAAVDVAEAPAEPAEADVAEAEVAETSEAPVLEPVAEVEQDVTEVTEVAEAEVAQAEVAETSEAPVFEAPVVEPVAEVAQDVTEVAEIAQVEVAQPEVAQAEVAETSEAPVLEAPVVEPVAEVAQEVTEVAEVAEIPVAEFEAAEVEADDAEVTPEAPRTQSVAELFAGLAPEPVAEVAPEPEPEPQAKTIPMAAAIDILPTRSHGGGLFRRHRAAQPAPAPAAEPTWAPQAPVAEEAPVDVPAAADGAVFEASAEESTFAAAQAEASAEEPTFAAAEFEASAAVETPGLEPAEFEPFADTVPAAAVFVPAEPTEPAEPAEPAELVAEVEPDAASAAPAPFVMPAMPAMPERVTEAPFVPQQPAAAQRPSAPTPQPLMPARTPAQVRVGAGAQGAPEALTTPAGLSARAPVADSLRPRPAPSEDLDRLAARSQMASDALSELRGLYEPSFTPVVAPVAASPEGLTRRTPRAPGPSIPTRAPEPSAPARARTAKEVRGMLSGFRAGVERGRTPVRLDHLVEADDQSTDSTAS